MESINHFKISALISPLIVAGLYGTSNPVNFLILAFYGAAAGVLIDLDHFVWARYNKGHWNHLLDALEAPFTEMTDNNVHEAVSSRQRYASHLTILGLAGVLTMTVSTDFMALTTGMIGIHILCDVYDSVKTR